MREFFSFSAWLTAGQIVNTLNWRFDYLLIGKMLGGTALGYYSVGSNLAMMPTREATAPLTQTIYPGFSSIRDDPARLAAAYQRVQALVAAIALPAGIGVAVIADPLVRLTLGEKWAPVDLHHPVARLGLCAADAGLAGAAARHGKGRDAAAVHPRHADAVRARSDHDSPP